MAEIQDIALIFVKKLTELLEIHAKLNKEKDSSKLEKTNKKLLILQFFLILVLDHPSGSFKLNLKKIFSSDICKVGKSIDLYELISINQK